MRRILVLIVLTTLAVAACTPAQDEAAAAPSATTVADAPGTSNPDAVAAPEFPAGLDWINTASPLTIAGLRGKVVLLDFWTYGCINCIHIIPELKRLEEKYAEELVVIGVHSAKFSNEAATENIAQVVQRYDLSHAVVNDAGFDIWNAWGARAWPTIALVDPAGNVVGTHAGEGVYDVLDPVIERVVSDFAARGELDPAPIPGDGEIVGASWPVSDRVASPPSYWSEPSASVSSTYTGSPSSGATGETRPGTDPGRRGNRRRILAGQ